jgi:geranylgeranyl diphosphate synthase type II
MKDNPFYKYIQVHKANIYSKIEEAIPTREPLGHYDLLADYPRRQGKYIRPGLLLLVCEVLGGDVEKILDVAAAMQLSEDWILVHDDIEDGSLTRRKGPALHEREDSSLGLALNAGDALHMVQWQVLMKARDVLGPEKTFALFDEMSAFLLVTAEGQYLEMKWTKDNFFVSEEDYYRMVDRKTGSYTIGGPMRLGAICADASPGVLSDLDQLAVPLGRAFQIHDDWLNIYSEDDQDKDFRGDLVEGKRTLLIHRAHELANTAEKTWLKESFGKPRAKRDSDDFKNKVVDLFNEYGCKDWVRNIALENAQRSRDLINGFPWLDDDGKRRLNEVVDLIILRDY